MTEVELVTELVVTEKVADVAPAATVTLAGTCAAAVLLLVRVTLAPPVGAAPLNVTVPVEELPPVTVAGFTATDDKDTVEAAGFTVRDRRLSAAVVGGCDRHRGGACNDTGSDGKGGGSGASRNRNAGRDLCCCVLLLVRVTVAPPVGAAPLNVTVPVDELPPVTLAGFTATEERDTVDDVPEAFNATISRVPAVIALSPTGAVGTGGGNNAIRGDDLVDIGRFC